MEKSEGPKASKREDGVDFISNMPDSILLLILSRLDSTEEAIRTSVLSRRWRYLWTSISSIDIFYRGNLEIDEFKEFVYWVLGNISVDLDCFRLGCFDHYSMSTVWRWVHMAITKNVKQLSLMFYPKQDNEDVEMPYFLVNCGSLEVLRLTLSYSSLRLHNVVTGFPALRVLHLTYVDFLGEGDLVKSFLESFPLLEDLTLLECVLCNLDLLCISCSKLNKLRIHNPDNMEDGLCGGIKISCPNLVDMDLIGLIANNFFFECLNSLNIARIMPKLTGNINSVLFPEISHVEHLWIDVYFLSQCIDAAHDSGLPNLKTLVLSTTIEAFSVDELNQILKHYPKVESLNLIIKKVYDGPEEWELYKGDASRIMTPDAKRIEFLEFKGEKPKLVLNWLDDYTLLEMVFSWGIKAKHFSIDYEGNS